MTNLSCKKCEDDNIHLIGTLHVKDNDEYQTTNVIVNHEFSIPVRTKYQYRSQNNIYLLFACESGHFFFKTFDGHKGNMIEDENRLMDGLSKYLNEKYGVSNPLTLNFNFELLGNIESYLKSIHKS